MLQLGGAAGDKGLSKLKSLGRVSDGIADVGKSVGKIPEDRLYHIFGQEKHDLGDFVSQYGNQENAYNAVQVAANQALTDGVLTPNAKGILPSGDKGNIINVGGTNVRLIGGKVTDGEVILSSFSRKGL
ncbi:hypothetical protein SYJ56_05020 [Algoriphagus sp. D3-2-R+10]|uniref:hypothetical protein n=1 Tax=Algoriphagus aurantiacus TaxID=3103948 RepID=UPI002B3DF6DD|nr:hypothetical protein [Algoriphagus sp. D3-2-R+10]MEB2774655.1 hypothetical protein [Algoriphagus sp. D3-2-R+10]